MAQEGPMSDDGSGKWNKCGNHLVKWRTKLKAKCCLLLQKLLQVHYLFWALKILLLRISPSTWVSRRHSHQVAPSRHASVCYSPRRGCGISSEGRSLNKVFNTCDGEGLTLGAFIFLDGHVRIFKTFSPPLRYANQYSRAAITNILPKYSSPFVFFWSRAGRCGESGL